MIMVNKLNNRYRNIESATQSADILRLVIPQISKHNLTATPINYTVWYEYYLATNLLLKQAIDEHLKNGEPLTNEVLASFFDDFIADPDVDVMKQAQNQMLRIIAILSETTKATDSNASDYHQSLQTMRNRMDESQQEITELRNKLDQITVEALSDALTGLVNRKGFSKAFETVMAQNYEGSSSISLLMVDIDHFKKVNDTHGHLVGDKVIKYVADTLSTLINDQGTASRFGGEEYAVLLPNTSLNDAHSGNHQK